MTLVAFEQCYQLWNKKMFNVTFLIALVFKKLFILFKESFLQKKTNNEHIWKHFLSCNVIEYRVVVIACNVLKYQRLFGIFCWQCIWEIWKLLLHKQIVDGRSSRWNESFQVMVLRPNCVWSHNWGKEIPSLDDKRGQKRVDCTSLPGREESPWELAYKTVSNHHKSYFKSQNSDLCSPF